MKTTHVEAEDFARSVLAVPPLAMRRSLDFNEDANRAMVRHIEAGGVSTLIYGGNANLHNLPVSRFAEFLAMIEDIAAPESWAIPSIGPDYGKLVDMARILRDTAFPCAMILPMISPKTEAGIAFGISETAEIAGKPSIVYIKEANYLRPDTLARLVDRGEICGIKYSVPRQDFRKDSYLESILCEVDRGIVVSGFGEPPAIPHLQQFHLAGFTAGCVCLAPRLSMKILNALKAGEFEAANDLLAPILPLEDLREQHSPIAVLHEAVRLAGIADTGPLMPLLSNTEKAHHPAIAAAVEVLMDVERQLEGSTVMAAE